MSSSVYNAVFAGIPFALMPTQGRVPDWTRPLIAHEAKRPSSNDTVVQYDGYGPWELVSEVLFNTVWHWQQFDALRGTSGLLRHFASITATAPPGLIVAYPDDLYVHWDGATLHAATQRTLLGGEVLATLTFRRPALDEWSS